MLNLPEIGLTPDSRGQLSVNENYQTEVGHIYAVADSPMRTNLWNETALKGLELALSKWVRLSANMQECCYTVHTAGAEPDPVWPDLTMAQLIELGFGEEKIIRSDQHPLIRKLLGRD